MTTAPSWRSTKTSPMAWRPSTTARPRRRPRPRSSPTPSTPGRLRSPPSRARRPTPRPSPLRRTATPSPSWTRTALYSIRRRCSTARRLSMPARRPWRKPLTNSHTHSPAGRLRSLPSPAIQPTPLPSLLRRTATPWSSSMRTATCLTSSLFPMAMLLSTAARPRPRPRPRAGAMSSPAGRPRSQLSPARQPTPRSSARSAKTACASKVRTPTGSQTARTSRSRVWSASCSTMALWTTTTSVRTARPWRTAPSRSRRTTASACRPTTTTSAPTAWSSMTRIPPRTASARATAPCSITLTA